jgi:GDP-4-dehydro-6-deoxy-D-mannose reductase
MAAQERRRILITGASGFVAGYAASALRERGVEPEEVVAAGRGGAALPGASSVELDLAEPGSIEAAVGAVRPTHVLHLAGISSAAGAKSDPGRAWRVNFEGTRLLASAVLRIAPSARFVFAGSAEAYGLSFNTQDRSPVSEDAALQPLALYGATKACAEIALRQMIGDGLDLVVFRAFNHTGAGQAPDFVVPAFASQIASIERGETPPVLKVGDLDVWRDLMDVRDVAAAYAAALLRPAFAPEERVLNLSSGEGRRIGDVLGTLLGFARTPIEVETDPSRLRPQQVPFAAGSPRRCESALGWTRRVPFERTLADVLDYWRAAK